MNKVILDLGCGDKKIEGVIGIDHREDVNPDIRHDLNKGIPFPDNSVDLIYARHFLEHSQDIFFMMSEIHRVLKVGGLAKIEVPYYSSYGAVTVLDHKYQFGYNSFDPWQKNYKRVYGVTGYFKFKKRYLIWQFKTSYWYINIPAKIPNYIVRKLTTNNPILVWIYQKFFANIFPCDAVYFELEKVYVVVKKE